MGLSEMSQESSPLGGMRQIRGRRLTRSKTRAKTARRWGGPAEGRRHLGRGGCEVSREVVGAGGGRGAEGDAAVAQGEGRAGCGGKVVLQPQILQPQARLPWKRREVLT